MFKIFGDAHGDLSYVRIYSGKLRAGELVYNARVGRPERANRLFRHACQRSQADRGGDGGDIVAIPGLKDTVTGDTLHEKGRGSCSSAPSSPSR